MTRYEVIILLKESRHVEFRHYVPDELPDEQLTTQQQTGYGIFEMSERRYTQSSMSSSKISFSAIRRTPSSDRWAFPVNGVQSSRSPPARYSTSFIYRSVRSATTRGSCA